MSVKAAARVCALVLLTQCTNSTEPELEVGDIQGRWATVDWVGDVTARYIDYPDVPDTLLIFATRPKGAPLGPSETLEIRVAWTGGESYSLANGVVRLEELVGGDVLSATYKSTSGTLTLISYQVGGFIQGSFNFTASSPDANRSYGETATFSNGHFLSTFTVTTPNPTPQ
jgi:hypothetical protein